MFSSIVVIRSRHASHLQRLLDLEFNLHLAFGYSRNFAIDINYMNINEEADGSKYFIMMCVLGRGCMKALKHLSKHYLGFNISIESVDVLGKEIRRDIISLGLVNSMRGLFMCRSTLRKYVTDMKITQIVPEGDVDTWWNTMYGVDTGYDQLSSEVEVFFVDNELTNELTQSTAQEAVTHHYKAFRRLTF